jgi:hypothetical protein
LSALVKPSIEFIEEIVALVAVESMRRIAFSLDRVLLGYLQIAAGVASG